MSKELLSLAEGQPQCWADPANPNRVVCYYGVVPYTEFIDGVSLASMVGLSAGVAINSQALWLKFSIDGKIIYTPMKQLRYSLSRNQLRSADVDYGNKTVTIKDKLYKVRLLGGLAPGQQPYNETGRDDPTTTHKSEYNRLLYNISSATYASQEGPKFAKFTGTDLALNQNGSYVWIQEYNATYGMTRGGYALGRINSPQPTATDNLRGWRPVLELVP